MGSGNGFSACTGTMVPKSGNLLVTRLFEAVQSLSPVVVSQEIVPLCNFL